MLPSDKPEYQPTEKDLAIERAFLGGLSKVGTEEEVTVEEAFSEVPDKYQPPTDIVGRTRAEHLAWCKERALEYVDRGDTAQAFASMGSDLGKHPETEGHVAIQLGMMQIMTGGLSTPEDMRKFINGFN